MVDKIKSVIFIIICIFCTKQCASDYVKGGNEIAISNYEKMIADSLTTYAFIYPEYEESTLKIKSMEVKTYKFRYHFQLDEQKYEGKYETRNIDSISPILNVHYLKTDPNINCVNPEKLLAAEQEKNTSKKDLYGAIFWGILSIVAIYSFISNLRKKGTNKDE
jgi:hypothetical protein